MSCLAGAEEKAALRTQRVRKLQALVAEYDKQLESMPPPPPSAEDEQKPVPLKLTPDEIRAVAERLCDQDMQRRVARREQALANLEPVGGVKRVVDPAAVAERLHDREMERRLAREEEGEE